MVVRTYKSSRKIVPPTNHKVGKAPSRKSLNKLVFILNNCDVTMKSMHTITVAKRVSKFITPEMSKGLLKAALQRLRRNACVTQYCWVREFQKNGSIHWHVFTDFECSGDGVDLDQSADWSFWWANRVRDATGDMAGLHQQYQWMAEGDGNGFIGSVRVEKLRDEAAGRYAGKEGAKRFQKMAPAGWEESGRRWGASRSLTCTPIRRVQVRESSLQCATVKTKDGKTLDVPYRNQFGRGKSIEDCDLPRKSRTKPLS